MDSSNLKLVEILVDKVYVKDDEILEVLEFQLGIHNIDLNKYDIDPNVVFLIPENIARRYELIAIDIKNETMLVAMSDPLNIYAIDDLKMYTDYEIQPVISTSKSILK